MVPDQLGDPAGVLPMASKTKGHQSLVQRALVRLGADKPLRRPRRSAPTNADLFVAPQAGEYARTYAAALNDWMLFHRESFEDRICDALTGRSTSQWKRAQANFLARGPSTKAAFAAWRPEALSAIRRLALGLLEGAQPPTEHLCWERLRAHLRDNEDRLLAGLRRSEIPFTFNGWLRGNAYCFKQKSREKLAILERHLGIIEGTFLSHSRRPPAAIALDLGGKAQACAMNRPGFAGGRFV